MASSYDVPNWAGKPPVGLHLDVLKDDKLVQKLMVDDKRCFLFGRNNQLNDFCIDHASCSRVHAAFVYHKHLNIAYLVDLGSTHGTFIGNLRLEAHKPTQLPIDSTFHFGASTRRYILRERPSTGQTTNIMEDLPITEHDGALLGLPETQTELDNLTEYNTAHNRRISMLGIADDNIRKQNHSKNNPRKRRNVTFNDEEIIINPEDVDPNIGRFRNLIQTTVIPSKRARFETNHIGLQTGNSSSILNGAALFQQKFAELNQRMSKHDDDLYRDSLYNDLPISNDAKFKTNTGNEFDVTPIALGTKLGLLLPNPAPEVTPVLEPTPEPISHTARKLALAKANAHFGFGDNQQHGGDFAGPQKKKYAKEAWPGRKPMLGQL